MKLKFAMMLVATLMLASPGMAYMLNGTAIDSCGVVPVGATVTLNATGNTTTVSSVGAWSFGNATNLGANLHNATYLLTMSNGASWNDETQAFVITGNDLNNVVTIDKKYCSSYGVADIPNTVIDFIGGILSSLAGAASPLVWSIVAGIIIALAVGLMVVIKKM